MAKDERANIKVSQSAKRKLQGLKKPGESYNQMAERLHCKFNPKDKKCKRDTK